MAYDEIKPRGSTKASKPDAGGAVLRSLPLFGIVKDNIDPIRSGRLQVYISDLGGSDPDDSNTWITVNYMSPFYGSTTPSGSNTGYGEYTKNPNSYGMWNSQPDIGTTVICIFINGDPNYGYWIGCVPDAESLHMIPAIGGSDNIVANAGEAKSLGGAVRLPVVNINTNNKGIADSNKFLTDAKPVHSYAASILAQQGLIRDPIRGVIGSSAQREAPSRVGWGVSTPGRPIYEGGYTDETIATAATSDKPTGLKVVARRGGHTLVMDDGDILGRDQLVRIRSSLGHQILMSDDGQTLFIIHANGQSYIELGKEGTIDMYATNSVNVRTQGDLNLHADNNINLNAAKQLNISADTIAISSEKETTQKVGTDFSMFASGKYTNKVSGQMSFASAADASFYSDAVTYINGSKINLNTGASSLVPQEVKPIPVVAHTDTLNDATKGWVAAPGKLLSIVSRAPAHAPWASANQGVDVKVNNNASAALPTVPSPAVAAANASTSAPTNPVSVAVASTVPPSSAISTALDKNTTGTMVGQLSTMAATGPAAAAVKLGAGVVETATGVKVGSVGILAQSPEQMEQAGILKPGSAALVAKLIANGKTIEEAMTSNLFTGMPGAENLQEYIRNTTAQVGAQVVTMQKAQAALTETGLITGKESGTQLAGLVMSAATSGVTNTVNFVKNAASSALGTVSGIVGAASGALNNVLGSTSGLISSGNFAGNMAATVTGGLSSIAGALGGMTKGAIGGLSGLLDSAKGVAGSAFSAITGALPTLTPGVPQNIREITEKAQVAAQSPSPSLLSSAIGTVSGAVNSVVSSATNLIKAVVPNTPGLASGLNALPGGEKSIASVVNNATGALNIVPGVAAVTGLIGTATSLTSGLTGLKLNPLASSGALNAATDIAGNLNKGLTDLKSGKLSLTSLASAGLPASAAAQFNSAICSLSSGGSVPITLATVATNTCDRSALDSLTAGLLGDNKIPVPNFNGNPASTGENTPSKEKLNAQFELNNKVLAKVEEAREARLALAKAKRELPAGDPQIDELRNKYFALTDELAVLKTVA